MPARTIDPLMLDLAALARVLGAAALAAVHPLVRRWRGDELDAAIAQRLAGALRLMTDEQAAQEYASSMRTLGLPAQHYRARLIEAGGARFLARIDFPSHAGHDAFVDVLAATTPPGGIADRAVFAGLAGEFGEFDARAVEFHHPPHLPCHAPARVCQHLLAAPALEIAAGPPAAGLGRVQLAPAADLGFYDRYKATYEAMWSERPALAGVVRIESRDSLEACRREGLLHEILVDGRAAGIIAARRRTVADLDSIFMVEIVLDREARGQRLGPAVHQRFAALIAALVPDAIVTGTIAPANVQSLAAAACAGRVEIGAWHRVEV